MKPTLLISAAILGTSLLGCAAQPNPSLDKGLAQAKVHVIAKPRAELDHGFVKVAVYDAALTASPPAGQFEHVDYAHLSNIIVWLEPVEKVNTSPRGACTVAINPSKPSTDVHAAAVGQKIILRNASSSPVTFYSVSDGNEFSLEKISPGATAEYTPQAEGLIEILTNPAKPPVAQLYAAPSPWVARAHAGQTLTFTDLPPGNYHAVSWHPRLPGTQSDVTLPPGEIVHCALTVGVNNLSKSPG